MVEGPIGPENKISSVLKQLCAVSFINVGVFTVLYFTGILGMLGVQKLDYDEFMETISPQIELMGGADALPGVEQLTRLLHESGALLMGLLLLRTIVRGIGVFMIYKGRGPGFIVYATAQLVGIFLPHIILPWAYLGFFGPLASVSMTALYGSVLRIKKTD